MKRPFEKHAKYERWQLSKSKINTFSQKEHTKILGITFLEI